MADQKVSDLPALNGANVDPADLLYIVDSSAGTAGSKKITIGQFQIAPVSGGTANGVLYLDASKVQASGTALTFDGSVLGITGNVLAQAAATQDAVKLAGRAGGTNSYAVTLTPTTLGGNRTLTLPDASTTVVGTDATQTLTNKTIEAGTFTNGYTEEVFALGTSGSIALNPANGSIQTCAAAGTVTFTDSLAAGQSLLLMLTGGSTYTINWPTVTWVTGAGNLAPTHTASDAYAFWKISTTLYATYIGSYA
jgi:hypothetical protein